MISQWLTAVLTAVVIFLMRVPLTFDAMWFLKTPRRRLDEDVSLLQLAEAFARKIERERALIPEKINDPEMIRYVSHHQPLTFSFCSFYFSRLISFQV
jgi:hypothetical protein